jgi:uncharacterized membrane protein
MAKLTQRISQLPRLSVAVIISSLVSLLLLVIGALHGPGDNYSYMVWNLFLAWLPPLFMVWLLRTLQHKRWSSWQAITISVLWLGFLPNSFYLVSDLVHLTNARTGQVLYDSVLFMSFALNGLLLGYISLYIFHEEFRRRVSSLATRVTIGLVLFMCSFAIYLGRDLRWNTWDVFVNPAGLLLDLSNRIISPLSYPRMFVVTGIFFVLLTTMYYVIWCIIRTVRQQAKA